MSLTLTLTFSKKKINVLIEFVSLPLPVKISRSPIKKNLPLLLPIFQRTFSASLHLLSFSIFRKKTSDGKANTTYIFYQNFVTRNGNKKVIEESSFEELSPLFQKRSAKVRTFIFLPNL